MINLINDKNTRGLQQLPLNANLINLSSISQIEETFKLRSFSIKYVIDGCERYQVNNNKYCVKKDEYILANTQSEGRILIDSKKPVIGMCIDLDPQLISEIAAVHIRPDTPFPDKDLAAFFHSEAFLDNKYNAHETRLGMSLNNFAIKLINQKNAPSILSKDFFYSLTENLVLDHISIFHHLNNVDKVKSSTRKDLYRRVLSGKAFLDAHYTEQITIESVAKEATISEYYFFKLFKKIYHTTPYNYLINKRLELAVALICEHRMNITDVAISCGFSDIHSFSKVFKKAYGCPPSKFDL